MTDQTTPVSNSLATATRSGFLSSEFALKVLGAIVMMVLGSGVMPDSTTNGQLFLAALAMGCVLVFVVIYSFQRFVLKNASINLAKIAVESYGVVERAEQAKLGAKAKLPELSPEAIAAITMLLNGNQPTTVVAVPATATTETATQPAPAPQPVVVNVQAAPQTTTTGQ